VTLQASSQAQLRQYIEKAERLEEELTALKEDLKDIFAEAKGEGFDPKIMKKIIAIRRRPKTDREEEEAVLATYMHALGLLAAGDDTPLGSHWRDGDGEEARA
jgi:uncharacterized protein (UPF0335 family)